MNIHTVYDILMALLTAMLWAGYLFQAYWRKELQRDNEKLRKDIQAWAANYKEVKMAANKVLELNARLNRYEDVLTPPSFRQHHYHTTDDGRMIEDLDD